MKKYLIQWKNTLYICNNLWIIDVKVILIWQTIQFNSISKSIIRICVIQEPMYNYTCLFENTSNYLKNLQRFQKKNTTVLFIFLSIFKIIWRFIFFFKSKIFKYIFLWIFVFYKGKKKRNFHVWYHFRRYLIK